jgi:hypothetical protein
MHVLFLLVEFSHTLGRTETVGTWLRSVSFGVESGPNGSGESSPLFQEATRQKRAYIEHSLNALRQRGELIPEAAVVV